MSTKRTRRLVPLGERQISLQNRTVTYRLKQSQRIRGIRLEIHQDTGLTVVVPKSYRQDYLQDVLSEKADWILRHLPDNKPVQMPLFHKEIDHGERLQYMGKTLDLVVQRDDGTKPTIRLKGNKLFLSPATGAGSRARILETWYRQEAARVFKEKADIFQDEMGLRYNRIVIRGQRKRWASASPRGNLSINWKLLMAPEAVIDYVIMHELAHFKYMDHSKKFWGYLGEFCPRWRQYRKWLIAHEDELKSSASFKI